MRKIKFALALGNVDGRLFRVRELVGSLLVSNYHFAQVSMHGNPSGSSIVTLVTCSMHVAYILKM